MHSLPGTSWNRKTAIIKATLLTLCAVVLALAAPATLLASPVRYDLTLAPGASSLYGGTGIITVDSAAPVTGQVDSTLANGKLLAVPFNGQAASYGTFSARVADPSSPSSVQEPSSLLLFATGLLGTAAILYRWMAPQAIG